MRSLWFKKALVVSCTLLCLGGCAIDPVPFPGPSNAIGVDTSSPAPDDAFFGEDVSVMDGAEMLDSDTATSETEAVVPDSDEPPPLSTSFQLVNLSSASVYVQIGTHQGWPTWYSVSSENDGKLSIHDDCAVPNCDDPDAGVCGIGLMVAQELKPTESITAQWDGHVWTHLNDAGPGAQGCEEASISTASTYSVSFCWGMAVASTDTGEQVSNSTCESVSFNTNETTSAQFVITDPSPDPSAGG